MELVFTEEGQFFRVWCWICTLILWFASTFTIYKFFTLRKFASKSLPAWLAIIGVSYVIVLINSFVSPTFSFLGNFTAPQEVQKVMTEMYKAPPVAQMHIECYHYEHREYYEKAKNGTYVRKTRTEKVITRTASDNVRIMSYRDTSQPLFLDLTGLGHNIKFLKLKLNQEVNFASDGSYNDYLNQVANFKYRNNWDVHYSYSETKGIQGFKDFLFVPLTTSSTVSYVGRGWYTLFSLLSMAELYKNYLNKYCKYHEYTVSKEISTLSADLFQASTALPEFRIITSEYDNLYARPDF